MSTSTATPAEPSEIAPSGTTDQKTVEAKDDAPQSTESAPEGPENLPESAAPEQTSATPYNTLFAQLPALIKEAEHNETYGVVLQPAGDHVPTQVIVQKFLRANANDVEKARAQLLATLKWRKEFEPLKARDEVFSKDRFEGLGYVVELAQGQTVTFNVYGAVTDNQKTFEDIAGFLRWRVGLMELGLSKLNLSAASVPLPAYGAGPDPYQGIQVHDYLNISFIRQNPYVKAASKQAITLFSNYYPETLSRKIFVNVPIVMGWMFNAAKLMLSKETVRKFTVLSYGKDLAAELGPGSKGLPRIYGGEADDLIKIGQGMALE